MWVWINVFRLINERLANYNYINVSKATVWWLSNSERLRVRKNQKISDLVVRVNVPIPVACANFRIDNRSQPKTRPKMSDDTNLAWTSTFIALPCIVLYLNYLNTPVGQVQCGILNKTQSCACVTLLPVTNGECQASGNKHVEKCTLCTHGILFFFVCNTNKTLYP